MTRWNGYSMCVARNNTLHDPLETSLRKDAEVTIYAIDDDGVVQDGQNGTNVEEVTVTCGSLFPTRVEWEISRQFEAVAKPLHECTDKLQGLTCTPDKSWVLIMKVSAFYRNPKRIRVPSKVTDPTKPRKYEIFAHDDLDPSIQIFMSIVARELNDRIISLGPTKNQLLCIYLNKGLNPGALVQAGVLTGTQEKSIDHVVLRELRSTKACAAATRVIPAPAKSVSREEPSKECEDWDNMDDLIMNTTKPAVPREAPEDPLAAEVEAFKAWSDFSYGMDLKGNFNPLIFWASPIIQMLFSMHAEMARSHFSGLHHEATSERTFSYTGRVISDLRRRMSADAVCANVIGAATHFEITGDEIFAPSVYQSRCEAAANK
mmetsp:Transcript_44022/g.60118  ORF Transcript_44022/g.60118 Transcript_44022/m.60118 type:complete len:375 (+) Transcript_44022:1617-2741(+)